MNTNKPKFKMSKIWIHIYLYLVGFSSNLEYDPGPTICGVDVFGVKGSKPAKGLLTPNEKAGCLGIS